MIGSIPKSELAKGGKRIDEILTTVKQVLKMVGYISLGDRFIPPDVNFLNFSYYRNKPNNSIDKYGKYFFYEIK